ncbi:acyl-coenzyme A synthetase/AMP-(fatty) acid ligase [Streptomyces sp. LBL]|nr:acyl-coenzyme A synthetase/AMP-(fatty) acid ligase [Streptomyces sp. LBL]
MPQGVRDGNVRGCLTGDSGHIDDDGYVFVMGRTNDVINVAGHRLSTGSTEHDVPETVTEIASWHRATFVTCADTN